MPPLPRIGITLGDPAGIGPEIVLSALQDARLARHAAIRVYGGAAVLHRVADMCRLPWPAKFDVVTDVDRIPAERAHEPFLVDAGDGPAPSLRPGHIQESAGRAADAWIRQATRDALAGRLDAIATAPIHKQAMQLAGMPFPGHTELLANLCGAHQTAMMFVAPEMTVTLATIHLPLAAVPGALTIDDLVAKLELTHAAGSRRLKRAPRIGVLALNPHGGEGGRFGDEEARVIAPAIAEAVRRGIAASGPLVPDAAFIPDRRERFDAYLAMYHDQALIAFKMLAFDHGVNVTLGLPFVRTSVDHGTAFDIAWQGRADCGSLIHAVMLAAEMSIGTTPRPLG